MKDSKKGFTLIELLAVIVILAIIAVIAVPAILNIVGKARKGASLDSAYGYLDAVEKQIAINEIKGENQILDGEYEIPFDEKYQIKVKGQDPETGKVVIEKSKIKTAELCINDYKIEYENTEATVVGKCSATPKLVKNSLSVTNTDGSTISGLLNYGTPVKVTFRASVKDGTVKSVTSPEGATVDTTTGEITYTTTGSELNLTFQVVAQVAEEESTGRIKISLKDYYEQIIEADSLVAAVRDNTFEDNSRAVFMVNGVVYSAHVYNSNSNLTISSDTEYGSQDDVATSASSMAKNMVILKVNGNLTINSGAKLTTVANTNGYGGPKGFLIYVTGNIINNGEISMTARGAFTTGQDVYLWKNANGSYEVVPAVGATGGESVYSTGKVNGNNGSNGKSRETAGGGSGSSRHGAYGGQGGKGTSYSGGAGGGGGNEGTGLNGGAGSDEGGQGGYSGVNQSSSGAGNPYGNMSGSYSIYPQNGTGGLLIIYGKKIENNSKISSKGMDGGRGANASGGASGGGSINIFYTESYKESNSSSSFDKIDASGGASIGAHNDYVIGGIGGTGSIAIGNISSGSYVDTYHNWTN